MREDSIPKALVIGTPLAAAVAMLTAYHGAGTYGAAFDYLGMVLQTGGIGLVAWDLTRGARIRQQALLEQLDSWSTAAPPPLTASSVDADQARLENDAIQAEPTGRDAIPPNGPPDAEAPPEEPEGDPTLLAPSLSAPEVTAAETLIPAARETPSPAEPVAAEASRLRRSLEDLRALVRQDLADAATDGRSFLRFGLGFLAVGTVLQTLG
ncbi:MAG: hypothetical protein V2I63_06345 [Pseudomonadales bacterium]|jgi:hypothetical protein|nr:hypothetical protein [Pseudomonadales bacterium]